MNGLVHHVVGDIEEAAGAGAERGRGVVDDEVAAARLAEGQHRIGEVTVAGLDLGAGVVVVAQIEDGVDDAFNPVLGVGLHEGVDAAVVVARVEVAEIGLEVLGYRRGEAQAGAVHRERERWSRTPARCSR